MWITGDVNLPRAILDAQSEGRLVFFVGAGVSVDAPSGLPLFGQLAGELAEIARVPFDKNVAIDFFLGSMPRSFDTHRHTRDIIARDSSAPNSTHVALVRVASSIGRLRIVTTNFDTHISSAAADEGIDVSDTWIGPALPLGDDFNGIVHLHGSVLREPRELVVTDRDFGRAYLTDAWVTRFLLPMFQRFTVLFVGYSHDDPIMRYLALGLPSGTPRYAFTSANEVNDSKWARLGVETISYPVQNHDHSALVTALEAWDVMVRRGQTEHRARIVEVVMGGTTLTPVDHDYLVNQLETGDGAREFVRAVAGVEPDLQIAWLRWAEGLPDFKAIFNGQNGNDGATVLGNWFCTSFIAVPELHGAALHTLQRLGQKLGKDLFQAAGWSASDLRAVDVDAGRRWTAFLVTSVEGHSAPVATDTILSYLPSDNATDLTVLRAALRASLVLKRRWTLDESDDLTTFPDAEVHWTTAADTLCEYILAVVEVTAPGDLTVGTALEDSLSGAYDLLEAYHGQRTWDPLSFGRAAIEPHEQDQFDEPVDAVIDGLRAYGEKALLARHNLPERWWSLDRALFRRLALHLVALDVSRTPDEKIMWLLERNSLYEPDLKHEVYCVLSVSAAKASDEARDRLLAVAIAGPTLPKDTAADSPDHGRHIRYATYNLLVWLAQIAPRWSEAAAALSTVQAENSDFAPRHHPDFNSWMTSGTWGGKLPEEPEDFIRAFEENPTVAIDGLLNRDYSERNFEEPTWHDALSLVSQVAEARPDLGEQFWALIDVRAEEETQASDLRRAIVEGWAKATLGAAADTVVARVETQVTIADSVRSIGRFLLEQVRQQIEGDETPVLAAMRRIALQLWREHGQSFTHSDGLDPNSIVPLYLNSWPGDVAQYWTVEVERRWRRHSNDWTGLNDDELEALTQLVDAPKPALDATAPALAGQLYFLFGADASFATEHVLPMFRDDATAALAWGSYLRSPRYNDRLLAAGLVDSTIAEWARLDALRGPTLRRHFFGLVASIVSFAGISPESRQALLDASVLADDGAHEAEFAHAVVRLLRREEFDGAEVWNKWLSDHLKARLNGEPRTLNREELACWADTIPYLGDSLPEAVELLSGSGVGLGDGFLLPAFDEGSLSAHAPVLVSYFAERIHNSSPSSYSTVRQVSKLIDTMRGTLGDAGLEPLLQAATVRGFIGGRAE